MRAHFDDGRGCLTKGISLHITCFFVRIRIYGVWGVFEFSCKKSYKFSNLVNPNPDKTIENEK